MVIHVSMREWLQSGLFGPVRLGMSRAQVQELLGPPVSSGGTSRRYRTPAIRKYGDIELHFGRREDDRLHLIYLDYFAIPTGGRAIALDPWIMRGGLPRLDVEQHLDACGIPYCHAAGPDLTGSTCLVVDSGVVLQFIDQQEACSPPPGLFAIFCPAQANHS